MNCHGSGGEQHLLNLEELGLRSNQLAVLPPEIGNLKKLERLDLCVNQLATMPDSTRRLKHLKHLDLCSNQLTGVPSAVEKLGPAVRVSLRDNPVQNVQVEFAKLEEILESSDVTTTIAGKGELSMGWTETNLEEFNRALELRLDNELVETFYSVDQDLIESWVAQGGGIDAFPLINAAT